MARLDLSSFRASLVGYVSGSLAIGTIMACYLLAKFYPHEVSGVAPLPFISDLGIFPPEVYVFRVGLVLAPAVFVMQAKIVYSTNRIFSSKICLWLGIISAMCLTMVAVVSEFDNLKAHCAFAFGFFILFNVYMVLISWWSFHDEGVSPASKIIKSLSAVTGVVAFVCLFVVAITQGVTLENRLFLALNEWIAALAIAIFQITLGTDLSNVEISVSMTGDTGPKEKKQD